VQVRRDVAVPTATADDAGSLARALRAALLDLVHITEIPMADAVARLDTFGPEPVLYLDVHSPVEDRMWAMRDAIRILRAGPGAGRHAIPTPNLRLVLEPGGSPD